MQLKINKDLVLNAIKNHKDDEYIDYVDESFLKDKDFIIRAISLNRKFMSLLRNFDYNFVKDVDIFNLVKEGKAIAKLYSKELYECLKYQLPEHELLCFYWSGGEDNFHGYKLFYEKKTGKEITKTQIEETKKTIIKELESKYCKDFLDTNHIQGYIPAKVNIGLFNNEFTDLYNIEIEIQFEPIKLDDLGDIKLSTMVLYNLNEFIVE
jgi:hypothetical protein